MSVVQSIIKQTKKGNRVGNLALLVASAIRMGKTVKEKSIPVIKAYACNECHTMAFVTFQDNKVTVKRCVCK
jgi:hypothetical protein